VTRLPSGAGGSGGRRARAGPCGVCGRRCVPRGCLCLVFHILRALADWPTAVWTEAAPLRALVVSALVLGRFSAVTCITRRRLLWASPRRLPGKSITPRDPVAAGWPAAGCASPPIGDDGRLQVVARRPLLGGAPLPDTSAVSPRTLPSSGVQGSLFFRFPPSSLPQSKPNNVFPKSECAYVSETCLLNAARGSL